MFLTRPLPRTLLAVLAALVLSVAAGPSAAQAQTQKPAAPAAAAASATAPAGDARRDYVLGAGDVVKVNVFQNPDLALEARINEGGRISYPLLGSVELGGLTVQEAEKRLADGLRDGGFLRQPQVSLLLMQVRGQVVSVLGMVQRPGRYPLEVSGLRLTDLLAQAGGVAATGSDTVVLSGRRDGRLYRQEVDLPSLFTGRGSDNDPLVQHGDVVFVDRMPLFYVYGEVQRGGAQRLERGMTVRQGLAAGGGLTQRGTEKGLRVHRRGADGAVQVLQPAMDDPLKDGDVIHVRESLF